MATQLSNAVINRGGPGIVTRFGIFVLSNDGLRRYDKSTGRLSALLNTYRNGIVQTFAQSDRDGQPIERRLALDPVDGASPFLQPHYRSMGEQLDAAKLGVWLFACLFTVRSLVPRWGHDPDALAAGRLPRAWCRGMCARCNTQPSPAGAPARPWPPCCCGWGCPRI